MRKKFLAMMLTAVMSASLVACGGSSGGGNGSSGGGSGSGSADDNTLDVQRAGTPETIDPALNTTSDSSNMIIHMSEGLLKVDQNGETIGGIAEKWEVSKDGLTYTFTLRDGLKWSDGSDLTANDIVYTWKRVADPATAAPYASDLLNYVEGWDKVIDEKNPDVDALAVSAPDDKTFVVKLSSPCTYFDQICAFAVLMPVKRESVETGDDWATNPATYVTDGPYKMTEYTPGDKLVMEKNENYWDAASITFDKITWHLIEDDNAAYQAFQDGTLDYCFAVPTEEIEGLRDKSDEYHFDPIMGTYYINFNIEKKPFDDVRVRKALSLAIDRDYVANTIMLGTYTPAKNFVGPGISDAEKGSSFEDVTTQKYGDHFNTDNYDKDLEEAKKLLAEAGYPDGKGFPDFTYSTNDSGFNKSIAEYLQSAWKELGLTCSINIQEWGTFSADRRAGNYEVARNAWVYDWDDPSNMINLFETSNGNNDGKYSNEKFDKLVDEARKTTDISVHYEKLHEAEQVLLDDAGCAPVAFANDFWMQKTNLKGAWHSPYGYIYFMNATKE